VRGGALERGDGDRLARADGDGRGGGDLGLKLMHAICNFFAKLHVRAHALVSVKR
jgi:hypothetical protein